MVRAQSTPAEFAEMSLQELFDLSINEQDNKYAAPKWHISYQYKQAEFDGYLDGDESLSLEQVLWSGPQETRTDKNFPVVPTVIKQRAHSLRVGYQQSDNVAFYLSVPYIEQETDHISIVPGYSEFLISTQGMGDTVASVNYKFEDEDIHKWWINLGISIPTGSIDELGDTPREPGDQPLPYTMQLGSGTWDFPIEFNYQHRGAHDFDLSFSAMLRSGSNDRQYRLGNNYRMSAKYGFAIRDHLVGYVGSEFQYRDSIRGRDETLLVEGEFPYPASITNPDLYGGRTVRAFAGLSWQVRSGLRANAEIGKPVYQHLNGPQPKESWRGSIMLSTAF